MIRNFYLFFRLNKSKNMTDTNHTFNQFTDDIGHDYMVQAYDNTHPNNELSVSDHLISGTSEENAANSMIMHAYQVMEEGQETVMDSATPNVKPKAVHQCPTCNKIFVSYKGLQQHTIIHTDQKPYGCDICGKSFRFKSNLFEHRSVHTNTNPHMCPICGKTCRLKGNLKKHLRTHCATKEELDLAWQPFARRCSHRRAPTEIPQDALVIRPNTDTNMLFTPPNRPKKRKMGLGNEAKYWMEKIRRGDLMPSVPISDKMQRLHDLVKMVENCTLDMESLYQHARAIPFERFDCLVCKAPFYSRLEYQEHIEREHPNARKQRPHFCDICLRSFNDLNNLSTHQDHHKRIQTILENNELNVADPLIMMPVINEADENDKLVADTDQISEEDGMATAAVMDDGVDGWEQN